jgi:hypothetical protein
MEELLRLTDYEQACSREDNLTSSKTLLIITIYYFIAH